MTDDNYSSRRARFRYDDPSLLRKDLRRSAGKQPTKEKSQWENPKLAAYNERAENQAKIQQLLDLDFSVPENREKAGIQEEQWTEQSPRVVVYSWEDLLAAYTFDVKQGTSTSPRRFLDQAIHTPPGNLSKAQIERLKKFINTRVRPKSENAKNQVSLQFTSQSPFKSKPEMEEESIISALFSEDEGQGVAQPVDSITLSEIIRKPRFNVLTATANHRIKTIPVGSITFQTELVYIDKSTKGLIVKPIVEVTFKTPKDASRESNQPRKLQLMLSKINIIDNTESIFKFLDIKRSVQSNADFAQSLFDSGTPVNAFKILNDKAEAEKRSLAGKRVSVTPFLTAFESIKNAKKTGRVETIPLVTTEIISGYLSKLAKSVFDNIDANGISCIVLMYEALQESRQKITMFTIIPSWYFTTARLQHSFEQYLAPSVAPSSDQSDNRRRTNKTLQSLPKSLLASAAIPLAYLPALTRPGKKGKRRGRKLLPL